MPRLNPLPTRPIDDTDFVASETVLNTHLPPFATLEIRQNGGEERQDEAWLLQPYRQHNTSNLQKVYK